MLMAAKKGLHPRDIDAFWLQRQLGKFYDDPNISQARSAEILDILKVSYDAPSLHLGCVTVCPWSLAFDQCVLLRSLALDIYILKTAEFH